MAGSVWHAVWSGKKREIEFVHTPSGSRYDTPGFYRRCGRSGIRLPLISLGLWHNFGGVDSYENARAIARRAFDLGVNLKLVNNS